MLKKAMRILRYVVLSSAVLMLFSTPALGAEITPHGSARFQQPSATININNNSPAVRTIWLNAIRAWNQTGAFTFNLSSRSDAQVTAQTNTALGNNYAGLTKITINSNGLIMHVISTLNPQLMATFHYTPTQEINVAEHELGHAIGLNHSPNRDSVMYASNRFYGIQPADIQSVRDLYANSPSPSFSISHMVSYRDPFITGVTVHTYWIF